MKIVSSYSGVLWCLLVGVVCVNAAQGLSIPFLTLYLTNKTHYSLWMCCLVIGTAPFFSIWGGFIGGQLSDQFGRLFLIYLSVFSTAFILILFGIAFQITNDHMQWVIILILNGLFGLFTSFFQPSVMALITDLVEQNCREQVFHLRYAAMNMGAIIGPLIGVLLGITLSPVAFFIGGIVYLGYGCVLYYVLKKHRLTSMNQHYEYTSILESAKLVITDKRLLNFILFHIFFSMCYSQLTSTLAYYIVQNVQNGIKIYSFVITLNAIFVVLGQAPIYCLCKNMAKNKVIFYGCVFFFLGCLCFSYSQNAAHFYISMFVITIGELLIFPFASGFIDDMAPAHLKGTYFGALTFREIGLVLGPILGGVMLQNFGGYIFFLSVGALSLGSYYFVVLYERAKYIPINSMMSLDKGV